MLLGAARYLGETRNFDGTAVVIFQPAEEGGAGGQLMVQGRPDGAFRHPRGLWHAQHAGPAERAISPSGPARMMASTDNFEIEIEGKGGHAARRI